METRRTEVEVLHSEVEDWINADGTAGVRAEVEARVRRRVPGEARKEGPRGRRGP